MDGLPYTVPVTIRLITDRDGDKIASQTAERWLSKHLAGNWCVDWRSGTVLLHLELESDVKLATEKWRAR